MTRHSSAKVTTAARKAPAKYVSPTVEDGVSIERSTAEVGFQDMFIAGSYYVDNRVVTQGIADELKYFHDQAIKDHDQGDTHRALHTCFWLLERPEIDDYRKAVVGLFIATIGDLDEIPFLWNLAVDTVSLLSELRKSKRWSRRHAEHLRLVEHQARQCCEQIYHEMRMGLAAELEDLKVAAQYENFDTALDDDDLSDAETDAVTEKGSSDAVDDEPDTVGSSTATGC